MPRRVECSCGRTWEVPCRDATRPARLVGWDGPRDLLTAPDLARRISVTPAAIVDRIRRGTLTPDYLAQWGTRTVYLFDPAHLPAEFVRD